MYIEFAYLFVLLLQDTDYKGTSSQCLGNMPLEHLFPSYCFVHFSVCSIVMLLF